MPLIRFDQYMEACLYGPGGFYSSGTGVAGRGAGTDQSTNRRGDFITSPEVGPLFGAVVARWLDQWWHENGQPNEFTVIDAGAGPGSLQRSFGVAGPPCAQAWRLVGVDPSPLVTEHPPQGERLAELPADLSGAVVVANELLDNLAFRIVDRADDGGWREVYVVAGPDGLPTEHLEPIEDPGLNVAPGQRAPWLDAASTWVADVLDRGAAKLLMFDYGMTSTAELAQRGGWLRTYQRHGRGSDPYLFPGELDITTDIAVDQLPPPSSVTTQAEWLQSNGIDELVEEGNAYWLANAARPDLTAMRMRSRRPEARTLLDPRGLGGWLAIMWEGRG